MQALKQGKCQKNGMHFTMFVARGSSLKLERLLEALPADLKSQLLSAKNGAGGGTPLHYACRYGNQALINMVLQNLLTGRCLSNSCV